MGEEKKTQKKLSACEGERKRVSERDSVPLSSRLVDERHAWAGETLESFHKEKNRYGMTRREEMLDLIVSGSPNILSCTLFMTMYPHLACG